MRRQILIVSSFFVFFVLISTAIGQAASTPVSCLTTTTTLDDVGGKNGLVHCIRNFVQRKNTDVFVVPTPTEQSDWIGVASAMLQGQCSASLLPPSMSFYSIATFTDGMNNQAYCVLFEKDTKTVNRKRVVTHGWGTLIVNNNATRELSIQIAHPWFDSNTPMQGAGVFKEVGARTFLMAGAHRQTNRALSNCQSTLNYNGADVAHNLDTIYHPVAIFIDDYYSSRGVQYAAIQFHGMSNSTCVADVVISHGVDQPPAPDDFITRLQNDMQIANPAWNVALPGDVACPVFGRSNLQGREINGVSHVKTCTTDATAYTGRFVHIEQKKAFRLPNKWNVSIGTAWDAFSAGGAIIYEGTVSGEVFLQGRSDNSGASVKAYQGAILIAETITDSTGAYNLTVPVGKYDVYAENPYYLYGTKVGVPVNDNRITYLQPVTLIGGDTNEDGILDVSDLYAVSSSFGTACPTIPLPGADWNGDCRVNILDLCGLGDNFGLSSPVVWP